MYYSKKSFKISVFYSIELNDIPSDVSDIWEITVYCRNRNVDSTGIIADYESIELFLQDRLGAYNKLNNLVCNPTEEVMANWICEQIVPCYKVDIKSMDGKIVTYEEDKI